MLVYPFLARWNITFEPNAPAPTNNILGFFPDAKVDILVANLLLSGSKWLRLKPFHLLLFLLHMH